MIVTALSYNLITACMMIRIKPQSSGTDQKNPDRWGRENTLRQNKTTGGSRCSPQVNQDADKSTALSQKSVLDQRTIIEAVQIKMLAVQEIVFASPRSSSSEPFNL